MKYVLLGRASVEMFVRRVGLCLALVDRAFQVLGRAINRVEAQRLVSGIDDVVLGPGGNDDAVVGLHGMYRPVDSNLAAASFETKELVAIVVDLFADFLAWFQRHQNKLEVLACVKHLPKEIVFFSQLLNVVRKAMHAGRSFLLVNLVSTHTGDS